MFRRLTVLLSAGEFVVLERSVELTEAAQIQTKSTLPIFQHMKLNITTGDLDSNIFFILGSKYLNKF